MRQQTKRFGRGTRLAFLSCVLAAITLPGLASASYVATLVDGTPAPRIPKLLKALGTDLVMTKVQVGTVSSMRPLMPGCPQVASAAGNRPVVERIGVSGRSVTFLVTRTEIAGCDRNPHARRFTGPWCGLAAWGYAGGRVVDPRLSICYRDRGMPLAAFGWINPVRLARWIVVDQPGYREVYPVAAGLPVRVSTVSGLERSGGAVFRTAQYDEHGVLLVRRKVVAAIAS
jgi:hypothetical protein